MNGIPLFPEQASNFAQPMDMLFWVLTGLTIFFCIVVFLPIFYFAAKYRVGSKADRRNIHHHNLKLELTWTIIPTLMSIPVFLYASWLYADMYTPIKDKDALTITVVGKQWMWQLQHPTGQRENDELHIPIGRPVKLNMISQDVIHAFFVPAFRIKKDVLPGRYSTQWFIATKPGKYRLFCAEYCGTKHSEMIGWVYAMEPADYELWLKQNTWGIGNLRKSETMAEAGQRLYRQYGCFSCHDPSKQQKAPTLAGIFGTRAKLSDGRSILIDEDYLRRSIYEPNTMKVEGYEPIMPTYSGVIDEQGVLQIIAYIKSLTKPQAVAPGAPLGQPIEGKR